MMKTTLATCLCSAAFATALFAQGPGASAAGNTSPDANTPAPAASTAPSAPAVPATTPGPVSSPRADDLESRIERNVKRGVSITFGNDDAKRREADAEADHVHVNKPNFDDGALMAIPIVGIIFSTLFGAPVLVVGLIMFFSYWKARSLHRTVRMMVEKGQPVPEALFAAPHSTARVRSDMRRGVVLMMVGFGMMVFFGAVNDWDGGAWAIGIIPFLIGAGYLLVWKLEGHKPSTDNTPRVP